MVQHEVMANGELAAAEDGRNNQRDLPKIEAETPVATTPREAAIISRRVARLIEEPRP
jgi:hypothetical protein